MEPIILNTAKDIYEAAKTLQKAYNVSKEMKTVAESEGKDQIIATKNLTGTALEMKQGAKNEMSSMKDVTVKGDLYKDKIDKPVLREDIFTDKLEASQVEPIKETETVKFIDKLSPEISTNDFQNVFIDNIPSSESSTIRTELTEKCKKPLEIDSSTESEGLNASESNDTQESGIEKNSEGLDENEKLEIKQKTGWSDKIIDAIRTKEEAQVYIDAGLVEGEVNGKTVLLQPKIDGKECNAPQWPDWSNKDLAEDGYPPRDEKGYPYELHHIGQNPDSPLAELTYEQHHSNGNFKILHTFNESSIDRIQFNRERKEYWSERSNTL